VAIPPVGYNSGYGGQQENGNLARERDRAQQQRRAREPVNKPVLGNILHPGAYKRNELAAKKELKIPMAQGSQGRPHAYAILLFFSIPCVTQF